MMTFASAFHTLAFCLLLALSPAEGPFAFLSSQQRDVPIAPPVGTAALTGTIVSDDASHQPIRRARVTLTGATASKFTANSDDNGQFVFRQLAAGRYTLEASKPAWLTATYGATRPGRAGTLIAIADGAHLAVAMTMTHGAVVTGVVRNPDGSPASGVRMSVMSYAWLNGERVLSGPPVQNTQLLTDDTGTYRAFGLPPGDVMIAALVFQNSLMAPNQDFRQVSPADVERATQLIHQGRQGAAPLTGAVMPSPQPPARLVNLAPVFYPGTTDIAGAATLTLAAGEERAGIDIPLQFVPTARVEGTIAGPAGSGPPASVALISTGPTTASGSGVNGVKMADSTKDGKYTFAGIPPGEYVLMAEGPGKQRAIADVVVNGQDLDVPLTLQTGPTLSGRVAFDSDNPPKDGSGISVRLEAVGVAARILAIGQGSMGSDQFRFDLFPGKYRVVATGPTPGRWFMRSSVARGQDTLDTMLDVRAGESISGWVVTLTDRPSELAGSLQAASGLPAPGYFVIVFPVDRSYWTPSSRRIQQTRPGSDGTFSVKGLPAGEYLVAALTDVEPDDLFSAAFLTELVSRAVRVTIADGQKTVQNLKIR